MIEVVVVVNHLYPYDNPHPHVYYLSQVLMCVFLMSKGCEHIVPPAWQDEYRQAVDHLKTPISPEGQAQARRILVGDDSDSGMDSESGMDSDSGHGSLEDVE